ncbi:hypothetical protein BTW32_30820, partial [Bacillus thuringiensis]
TGATGPTGAIATSAIFLSQSQQMRIDGKTSIPFNNTITQLGTDITLTSPSIITLNSSGTYSIQYNVMAQTISGQSAGPTIGLEVNDSENTAGIQSRSGSSSITTPELISGGAIITVSANTTLELINANTRNAGDFTILNFVTNNLVIPANIRIIKIA